MFKVERMDNTITYCKLSRKSGGIIISYILSTSDAWMVTAVL